MQGRHRSWMIRSSANQSGQHGRRFAITLLAVTLFAIVQRGPAQESAVDSAAVLRQAKLLRGASSG